MQKKGVMAKSFIGSFRYIKKSPFIFFMLYLMQCIFIAACVAVIWHFGSLFENSVSVIEDEWVNLSANSVNGIDLFSGFDFADELVNAQVFIWKMFLSLYLCYFLINSVIWNLTNMMVTKFIHFFRHIILFFGVLTLVFAIPSFFIINVALEFFRNAIDEPITLLITSIFISIIASYFMYTSFALIPFYKVNEFFSMLKKTFLLCFTKWRAFASYIIAVIVSIIPLIIIYYTFEFVNIYILFILIFFIWPIFANWSRLFIVAAVHELMQK
jgi:hypothetical protein